MTTAKPIQLQQIIDEPIDYDESGVRPVRAGPDA